MARAALGLSISDLAALAGVRPATVSDYERGSDARQSTVNKLRSELEAQGAVFLSPGEASLSGGAGVRLKA